MKKIVAAASIAALAASAAFADAKITLNGRLRPYLFSHTTTDNGTKETTTNEWMSMDGLGAFEDTLKMAFTGENAGITFSVNIKNGADESYANTYTTASDADKVDGDPVENKAEKDGTRTQVKITNNKNGAFLTLNQFDIWSNVFGTQLKVGAGSWKDGNADGAYRVKKDVDAQNAEGLFFERFKLGSAFKSAPSSFVDDIVNINGGSNALAGYVEYPWAINDDMTLKLTAVAMKSDFDTIVDDDTTTNYKAAWTARAQFNMADTFDSELIFKKPAKNVNVIALYAKPKMLSALDATVGFSYTMASGDMEKWNGAMDFDLRARYDLRDAVEGLSITYFGKISMLEAGDETIGKKKENAAAAKVASDIVGLDGKAGLKFLDAKDITNIMWNNLSARYVINDKVAALLNVGLINVLGNESDAEYGIHYNVTPGAQLFFSKAASCYAGVSFNGASYNTGAAGAKDQTVSCISVPVIFRVKM